MGKSGKNIIVLNSKYKDSLISFKIRETKSKSKNDKKNVSIKLNIANGLPLENYYCQVFINDNSLLGDDILMGTRANNDLHWEVNQNIDSIYLIVRREPKNSLTTAFPFPIFSGIYKTIDKNSDLNVSLSFNDSLFYNRVFNNEKLKVKKNEIKLFNPDTKKWEAIGRVADSLNIMAKPNIYSQ